MISLKKYYPRSVFMQSIAEYYQWIEVSQPLSIKTIPNGRVDAWINFQGSFKFITGNNKPCYNAGTAGFFPLTNSNTLLSVPQKLVCLNIKFLPHILAFSTMAPLLVSTKTMSFDDLFGVKMVKKLISHFEKQRDIDEILKITEAFFETCLFNNTMPDKMIQSVLYEIENNSEFQITVRSLAQKSHVSVKTLERKFKQAIGINPKSFCKIVRFQKAIKRLQNHSNSKIAKPLSISLSEGYFDQSHFIKDKR